MADHNLPTVASTYTNVLAQIDARLDDIALGLNSAHVTATNLPVNTIRWNATSNYWEKYGGVTWAALSTTYNININGTVGATTPGTGAFTTLSTSGVAALAASSTVGGSLIVTAAAATTFTGVQSFTNATSPIIVAKIGPTNLIQHALPSVTSDTIALIAATQTFTNKTYSAGALSGTFSGNAILSGQISFTNATAGVIVTTIGGNATQRHTIPLITSDTLALLAATQTLTNKTLGAGTVYSTKPTYAFSEITSGAISATTIGGNSLSVSGAIAGATGSFSGKVSVSNGTAASPSIAFTSDGGVDTGFYWTADGYTNFANNGVYAGNMGPSGNFTAVGNITAYGSATAPSDIRLKTNITRIENALDKVCQLGGYTFDRTDRVTARQTGVIAQEVQKVLPEAIIELDDENKTLTVAYGNMIGILIEAIKELREEVKNLK